MMKEGKLANGLLGSTALIVQKSHQINTESHLQPFFSSAFQNGLSNENSEITKAPIRLYAHSFSSASLKAFECGSEGAHRFTTCLYSWESFFFSLANALLAHKCYPCQQIKQTVHHAHLPACSSV